MRETMSHVLNAITSNSTVGGGENQGLDLFSRLTMPQFSPKEVGKAIVLPDQGELILPYTDN